MKFEDIEQSIVAKLPIANEKKVVLQRRINKFKKSPISFLEGSYEKRSTQIRKYIPIKYNGLNNFTIVSAVYNVEKYLGDYFYSLINQSLSFKKNIQVILVDDGSTDSSADIIKKWQKKYPNNIFYIYKENGGQASARNVGLDYVKTDWVTFIDPDDYVNLKYFKEIDDAVKDNNKISMVVTNIKFFLEKDSLIKDTHPLRHRFSAKTRMVANNSLDNNINLSSAATFFRTSLLKNKGILFSENVKPNFEDGKLIADYLLESYDSTTMFLKDAIYLYRKREDNSSTLDSSWRKHEKYDDVFRYGFLEVLNNYINNLGFIPKNIQKTILYDLVWYIQYLMNKPEKLHFLSNTEKEKFYSVYREVFSYIDDEVVMEFKFAGAWFFHKVGVLGAFKNSSPPFQIIYVEKVDKVKKQILLSFFTHLDVVVSYSVNGKDIIPAYTKKVINTMNEGLFVQECIAWVPFNDEKDCLTVLINDKHAKISLKGQFFNNGVTVGSVLKAFYPSQKYQTDNVWLLMDRETKADDNAEHFYRYLRDTHPEQDCVFALNKGSNDWSRLELEGFNLIEFGSIKFEKQLQSSPIIISSHLEAHINDYFGDNYEFSKKFIFLQHGVIKHSLSAWINTKKNIDTFITTTYDEYDALTYTGNYKLTKKEVVLTGLPRHDVLLKSKSNFSEDKTILIMPTWRHYIVGNNVGVGSNTRDLNNSFFESDYAKYWKSFLHSDILEHLVNEYGYKLVFAPHSNIGPYLSYLNVPSYIKVLNTTDISYSIQKLFLEASLLITDYSSVAFEMAILNKPTIYYQFDQIEMFSGAHTVQKGYFSYEEDGFGPVVTCEIDVLKSLESILKNDEEFLKPYKSRMMEVFPYRDGKNCERVYEAILALDKADEKVIEMDIVYEMTLSAHINESWELVESRSTLLVEYGNEEQKKWAKNILNEALFNQNKFIELFETLESNTVLPEQEKYWKARVAFATANWQDAIKLIGDISILNHESIFMLLLSHAALGNVAGFEGLIEELKYFELNPVQSIMVQAWALRLNEQWDNVIQLLEISLPNFNLQQLREYQPQILMAQAYRHLAEYTEAHQQLVDFESHSANNINCRIEIARLAFSRENYDKCINQYEQAVNGAINILSENAISQYLLSHWNMENIEELANILPDIIVTYPDNMEFNQLYIRVLTEQSKWIDVIEEFSKIELEQRAELIYPIILAKYRLGFIDEAYNDSVKPTIENPYEYWSLIGEIALLVDDIELAKYCYKGMIAIYPEHDSSKNWIRFNGLKNNL